MQRREAKIGLRDRKRHRRPKERNDTGGKSPQKRPIPSRRRDLRFRRTGWWCAQSHANRSLLNISLFSGNLTGKFAIFRPWRHFYIVEAAVPQRFFTKFPKKINRVKLSDNRDRNRVNSEIQSRYQKRPASLPHTLHLNFAGENRLPAAARDVSNEIGSPVRCDQALDPLIAFVNCRAQFKAKSQLSVRKLLYGCLGLSHNPALLSHMTCGSRWCRWHAGRRRTACPARFRVIGICRS